MSQVDEKFAALTAQNNVLKVILQDILEGLGQLGKATYPSPHPHEVCMLACRGSTQQEVLIRQHCDPSRKEAIHVLIKEWSKREKRKEKSKENEGKTKKKKLANKKDEEEEIKKNQKQEKEQTRKEKKNEKEKYIILLIFYWRLPFYPCVVIFNEKIYDLSEILSK